jgi:NAD-dependent dihydropyrimidine dehydrogenase PreA subunit
VVGFRVWRDWSSLNYFTTKGYENEHFTGEYSKKICDELLENSKVVRYKKETDAIERCPEHVQYDSEKCDNDDCEPCYESCNRGDYIVFHLTNGGQIMLANLHNGFYSSGFDLHDEDTLIVKGVL